MIFAQAQIATNWTGGQRLWYGSELSQPVQAAHHDAFMSGFDQARLVPNAECTANAEECRAGEFSQVLAREGDGQEHTGFNLLACHLRQAQQGPGKPLLHTFSQQFLVAVLGLLIADHHHPECIEADLRVLAHELAKSLTIPEDGRARFHSLHLSLIHISEPTRPY